MNRRTWIVAAAATLAAPSARADKPPTAELSAEDLELARYLALLEELDMLEDWEMLQLMPLLENDDEN